MSSFDLDLAVYKYGQNVRLALQQTETKLAGAVMVQSASGKLQSVEDRFDSFEMSEVIGRDEDITPLNPANIRRWIRPRSYDGAVRVDHFDKLRLLEDPMSAYAASMVAAINRRKDDSIIAGIYADAIIGEDGGSTVAFASGQQLNVNVGGGGSATGLNVEKILRAKQLMQENETDDMEETFMLISPLQQYNLLRQPEVISGDYANTKVLGGKGEVIEFAGVKFIISNRIPTNASSYRRNVMWKKSGLCLGVWDDMTIDVSPIKTKRGQPWQIYGMISLGGTRTDEKKVIEIPCSEA